jgi:hypothetical protein
MTDGSPTLPGPIRQNAYIVKDLDVDIAQWVRAGIGPWFVMRSLSQVGSHYRGMPTAPEVSIGLANSGELQLEVICQEDHSPSIYREFLDGGNVGFHHVAFWTPTFDDAIADVEGAGWEVVHHGNAGGVAMFAYFDAGGFSSTVIEIMELNDATNWMTKTVREAAADWDGSDPVRSLWE